MSTTSSFSFNAKLQVIDRAENFDGVGQSNVVYSGYDKSGTEEDVRRAYFELVIGAEGTGGVELIDLTDLSHELGNAIESVDGSGQQLLYYRFGAGSGNTGDLVIVPHSVDGYEFAGADSRVVLKPSQWVMGGLGVSAPDVSEDACFIRVSGTDDDVLEVTLIMTNNVT